MFSLSSTGQPQTTTGLDSAIDPVQMKNVTFEHVKGILSCLWLIHKQYLNNTGILIMEKILNALICPGHLDMEVTVPRQDVKGRTEILKLYLSKIKFDQSVDPEIIARGSVGFSGVALESLVNQAALKAAVGREAMVTMTGLELSKGPEHRSVEIDDKNQTITAYHESGPAVTAYYTKAARPVGKATGTLWRQHWHILGASSDFDNATKIAKWMVTKFGMSEKKNDEISLTSKAKGNPVNYGRERSRERDQAGAELLAEDHLYLCVTSLPLCPLGHPPSGQPHDPQLEADLHAQLLLKGTTPDKMTLTCEMEDVATRLMLSKHLLVK
ncbi:Atp-Dependent Zinc Metalloprotease Yme1L1 [Manis pentadactyla]|nr:Atp-Dependent Zinc Metalloprotease Yme1L1 [Manis pentadactyla]